MDDTDNPFEIVNLPVYVFLLVKGDNPKKRVGTVVSGHTNLTSADKALYDLVHEERNAPAGYYRVEVIALDQ